MKAVAIVMALGLLIDPSRARPFRALLSRAPRRHPQITPGDVVLLGDLVVLGLLAGMTFPVALAASAEHVDGVLAGAIRRHVRTGRLDGSSAGCADASGPLAALLTLARRAAVTGAPMVSTIAGFTAEARNAARTRALEDARRLSVRLLFPLALLILPGFVLLVAGPVVLEGLARFEL